ncbi:hypothetical protein AN958_12417 [Leucoagaricus sp. SymC.cos]|nr:hypothetical protein AN958_12417 [Leucoagaricus sp. SymC.cos]
MPDESPENSVYLANEIFLSISSHLDWKSYLNMSSACRAFRTLLLSDPAFRFFTRPARVDPTEQEELSLPPAHGEHSLASFIRRIDAVMPSQKIGFLMHDTFGGFLQKFNHLQAVRFHNVDFSNFHPLSRPSPFLELSKGLRRIEELAVTGRRSQSFPLYIIANCRELKTLKLDLTAMEGQSFPHPSPDWLLEPHGVRAGPEELSLFARRYETKKLGVFLSEASWFFFFGNLRSIKVEYNEYDAIDERFAAFSSLTTDSDPMEGSGSDFWCTNGSEEVGRILRHLPATLEELELQVKKKCLGSLSIPENDLSGLCNLRTLKTSLLVWPGYFRHGTAFKDQWLDNLLRDLERSWHSLESLTFQYRIVLEEGESSQDEVLDMIRDAVSSEVFDRFLDSDKFYSLKQVLILVEFSRSRAYNVELAPYSKAVVFPGGRFFLTSTTLRKRQSWNAEVRVRYLEDAD